MKRLLLLLIPFVTCTSMLSAQDTYTTFMVKGGHNALFGHYTALSADVGYEAERYFSIHGGAEYNTIDHVAVDFRPRYFHDFNFGRLNGELLLGYTYQSNMHNYVVGCGASLDVNRIWVTVGYYHRTITLGRDNINEPFNIYYELGIRCLRACERWDLNLILTNCRIFELERHYQPSYVLDAWWYPTDKLGVLLGGCFKPAGVFNISSEYFQVYANIGVCCKW